ncbi:FAD:protein FMN transferase [Nocardiopsis sediminis]|uniref:FAD:protein FMN transferase n=1 Tax=Nocardiopsis sediminis TaxID=1778267 RepID=A0ABV8FPY4_9ACTN
MAPEDRGARERLMGTEILLAALGTAHQAQVFGWLGAVERTFSRFTTDSDTTRVNSAGGRPTEVAPMFAAALAEACAHCERTGGLFDPFLAADMERIGYDRDFALIAAEGVAGSGHTAAPPRAPRGTGAPRVEIDHDRHTVTLSPGLHVDLGGFVKGWSVQQAADALRRGGAPRGLIDAGGDIAAWRTRDDPPWRIGVEHPLTGATAAELTLAPATSVATSSIARRTWQGADGTPVHHLLDPRTGAPAVSDCAQATVFASDLGAAEVYATCLVLLGTGDGPDLLADLDATAAWMTVDRDGRVRPSPNLDLHCHEAAFDDPS